MSTEEKVTQDTKDAFLITVHTPCNIQMQQWFTETTLATPAAFQMMFGRVVEDALKLNKIVRDHVENGMEPHEALKVAIDSVKRDE